MPSPSSSYTANALLLALVHQGGAYGSSSYWSDLTEPSELRCLFLQVCLGGDMACRVEGWQEGAGDGSTPWGMILPHPPPHQFNSSEQQGVVCSQQGLSTSPVHLLAPQRSAHLESHAPCMTRPRGQHLRLVPCLQGG